MPSSFKSFLTRRIALLALVASTNAGLLDFVIGGVAKSILDPLLATVQGTLRGDGLIDATLGAVKGVLGVDQEFDYVVVGAGTAGAAIGVRLAEAGYSVAIIEAGGFYEYEKPVLGSTPAGGFIGVGASILDSIPTVDWGFITEPQAGMNNRQLHYTRGKCVGGSSALNFMVHHRGTTQSYQKWADTVDDQSYTLDNLFPYFKKSVTFTPPRDRSIDVDETYDESAFSNPGGPVQVGYGNWVSTWATYIERAFLTLGLKATSEFNNGKLLGYHYSQSTIRASDQTRSSSASYVHSVISGSDTSKNLKVFTQTQARRILFDKSSGRPKATGVEVSALVGLAKYTIGARHEVIVSAGTFQSPQILMMSGIGPSDQLSEYGIEEVYSAPGVGQNMWDHILFGPTYAVKFATVGSFLINPVQIVRSLTDYVTDSKGVLTYTGDILGWEKLSQLGSYRSKFSQQTIDALDSFPEDWPEVEHIAVDAYVGNFRFPLLQQPFDGHKYVGIIGAMTAPMSRGNITLRSSNPLVKPALNPNWLTDPVDQEVAVSWYRRMREVFATKDVEAGLLHPGVEKYPGLDKDTDEEILEAIKESAITVWHAASTCRMGKSTTNNGVKERVDEMDVIDSEAKVFGVDGVRIVDASAFPFLPPGHPQSTIYALAEKIADNIVQGRSN